MAKEMNVSCNFLTNWLVCDLPEQMMDVLLKVRTRTGEHTFREDIYTHTLKYRRWNNELRPFRSLKRQVANIFQKWNSLSDDSKGTSTQTIVNDVECEDERSIPNSNKRYSIHSDWSDLLSVNEEVEYRKIYKIEVNQTLLVWLPHQLFPLLKLPRSLLFPQLKRLLKYCFSAIYAQTNRLGKLVYKITICHKHYCQSSCNAIKSTGKRRGRIGLWAA